MTDKDYTHILLIVDRSGSMHGIHTDMNGAILKLLADQAKEPGRCLVDIVTFDNVIERPYSNVHPNEVKGDIIQPRSSTSLHDAIGMSVVALGERLAALQEEERPGLVTVVVVTDGMENSSKEYNQTQVKALVEEQTDRWGWKFVFLGANIDSFFVGGGYGIGVGQTMNFAPSAAGVSNSYDAVSKGMSAMRTNTSRGVSDASISFTEKDREQAMSSES